MSKKTLQNMENAQERAAPGGDFKAVTGRRDQANRDHSAQTSANHGGAIFVSSDRLLFWWEPIRVPRAACPPVVWGRIPGYRL
jgi:hypothetical protein